jgi:hypothetical protein
MYKPNQEILLSKAAYFGTLPIGIDIIMQNYLQ